MPAVSTITLADGQATPGYHDFVPFSVSPQLTQWVNREGETSAGYAKLTASLQLASGAKKTNSVKYRLAVPKLELDSNTNSYKVVSTARVSIDVVIPDNFTDAERLDLAAYQQNMLANVVFFNYVKDLDPAF